MYFFFFLTDWRRPCLSLLNKNLGYNLRTVCVQVITDLESNVKKNSLEKISPRGLLPSFFPHARGYRLSSKRSHNLLYSRVPDPAVFQFETSKPLPRKGANVPIPTSPSLLYHPIQQPWGPGIRTRQSWN
jgi:hypothetical protein